MVKFTEEMKTTGFELIPEGDTVLRVKELKAVKNMGKIKEFKGKFVDSKGRMIFNTYNVSPTNKYYVQAMRSLYSLLKTGCALSEGADGEINEEEAVGKYFIGRIKHTEGNDGRVFQNLTYIVGPADDFDALAETAEEEMAGVEDEDEDDPYA